MVLYVKYMAHGDGKITLKGFTSVETRDLAKTPDDMKVEPEFIISTKTGASVHRFQVKAIAHSYWWAY